MSYLNLRHDICSSVPNTAMSKSPAVFLYMFTEYETIGPSFQKISGFFLCNNLSRVSFGWSVLVKGLYLRALDAGKLKQKYNSGTKPRSGSRGSRWTLAPLDLLSAPHRIIVLRLMQVDFLQAVISVHSQIFQRIQQRNVRVRTGAEI